MFVELRQFIDPVLLFSEAIYSLTKLLFAKKPVVQSDMISYDGSF
jgi:hypothetical protein